MLKITDQQVSPPTTGPHSSAHSSTLTSALLQVLTNAFENDMWSDMQLVITSYETAFWWRMKIQKDLHRKEQRVRASGHKHEVEGIQGHWWKRRTALATSILLLQHRDEPHPALRMQGNLLGIQVRLTGQTLPGGQCSRALLTQMALQPHHQQSAESPGLNTIGDTRAHRACSWPCQPACHPPEDTQPVP